MDKTVYPLTIKAGETTTLQYQITPKVTDTLIELFKIDMETQKDNPQGNASLEGAEFTWKYYAGFYNKDNLPAEATRTWVTKTIAETDSDGTTHYITKLADTYKVSGDSLLYAGRQGGSSTWNTNRRRNKSSKRLLVRGCIYAG